MDERLLSRPAGRGAAHGAARRRLRRRAPPDRRISRDRRAARTHDAAAHGGARKDRRPARDRTSVLYGRRVAVRGHPGGRPHLKQTTTTNNIPIPTIIIDNDPTTSRI